MKEHLQFYIDGQWTDPVTPRTLDVITPSTEEVASRISLGSAADVDKAVTAARRAFDRNAELFAASLGIGVLLPEHGKVSEHPSRQFIGAEPEEAA